MKRSIPFWLRAALWCAGLCAATVGAGDQNLPLPEIIVAKAVRPPTIDGKMDAGEWDSATAVSAFVVAFEGTLCPIQSVAWVTYDDQFVYVCLKNFRGPTYTLLSKRGRKPDDAGIVFDHSNEVWFSPPAVPAPTYQTLFNTYPGVFDCKMIPSVGSTSMAWSGKWEFAASETKDYWIIEAKAPIKSFGFDKIADGATWRALFCTDVLGQNTGGFRAWAPGGGFAEINRHGFLHFKDSSPVVQFLEMESIFTGKADIGLAVTGPAKGKSDVDVQLRFGAGVKPAAGDLVVTKKVSVADGKNEAFRLTADLTALNLPKGKDGPAGVCEMTAKSADGAVLYHQVFPFTVNGYVRKAPEQIKTTPYETPFGLNAFYAPLSKKLIVKIDRYYLPERAAATRGTARLIDPKTKKAVVERDVAAFYCDYSEFPMDLASIEVPVETEEDWAKNEPIRKANAQLKKEGKPLQPLVERGTEYTLEVDLCAQDGKKLATTSTPAKLKGYQFEWSDNKVGISDQVIPPWTPIKHDNGTLSMWNKEYRLNGLGLAEKIVNSNVPQLSGAMKLVAMAGGKELAASNVSAAKVEKLTDAAADLTGVATFGDLAIETKTRVEFDGFVLNTMTLKPQKPVQLDRLSLVVKMPKSEAPCLVASPGGWSAYHGWTPEKWDSRETTLGTRVGNFVAYIFLTDSERGFCYFADNEKGWILDPKEPTQEVFVEGDTVTLRVNFITKPGTIEQPTTIQYGWSVSPQKPQPKGWRNWYITGNKPNPKATCVFWCDADWAVLWPYYCSPYPWNYDKSKAALVESPMSARKCVGNIAHAIARYCDYKGRWFNELGADWGESLGDLSNGNVARSRGPNDFQLWHFDRWSKLSGLSGLYFDENYTGEDNNYLTGGAYLLPDGRIQPGYSYLGLREYNKRLRYMFQANGKPGPNIWLHTTGGQPTYAWMPDVGMEGENVEPTGLDNDYIECLPAGRLRAIGLGVNLGCAPFIMAQADRHWNDAYSPFTTVQFIGWVLAHDCLPEQASLWSVFAAELQMWRDDIRFLPYWKTGQGVSTETKDVIVSAHARPGHAVLWVMNTAREDRKATVKVDMAKLGFDAAKTLAFDMETGERYALKDGTIELNVPKRMWRAVRLQQSKMLAPDQTFVAHFETEGGEADECLGGPLPTSNPPAKAEGKTGSGIALDAPVSYGARQHVAPEAGTIACQVKLGAKSQGALMTIGGLKVSLGRDGKATLEVEKTREVDDKGKKRTERFWAKAGEGSWKAPADATWQDVKANWKGVEFKLTIAGAEVITAKLDGPPPIRPMGRGLEILNQRANVQPPTLTFGPVQGAALDDLEMSSR